MAQSLADAQSSPAHYAAAPTSDWKTTTVAPDPPKSAIFDHWQAKIVLTKPSFARAKKPASTETAALPATSAAAAPLAEHPYALHGLDLQHSPEPLPGPAPTGAQHALKGLASYYGKGTHTATGEAFNPNDMTAAHRTLPFGTRVRVTRSITAKASSSASTTAARSKPGRVIDLSQRAAEHLRMTDKGLALVKLEVLRAESQSQPGPELVAQRSPSR